MHWCEHYVIYTVIRKTNALDSAETGSHNLLHFFKEESGFHFINLMSLEIKDKYNNTTEL